MFNSSKGKIFKSFELDLGREKFRTILFKPRTTNRNLPVETGRWIRMP